MRQFDINGGPVGSRWSLQVLANVIDTAIYSLNGGPLDFDPGYLTLVALMSTALSVVLS